MRYTEVKDRERDRGIERREGGESRKERQRDREKRGGGREERETEG